MAIETIKKAAALIAVISDGITKEEMNLPKELQQMISVLRAVNPDMYIFVEKGDKNGTLKERVFIKFYPRVLIGSGCKKLCEIIAVEENPFFGEMRTPTKLLSYMGFNSNQFSVHHTEEEALDIYMKANPAAGAGRILNFMKFTYPEAVAEYERFARSCFEFCSMCKGDEGYNTRKANNKLKIA